MGRKGNIVSPGTIVRMLETYRSTHRGEICLILRQGAAGSYEVTDVLTGSGVLMTVLSCHLEFCIASSFKTKKSHRR